MKKHILFFLAICLPACAGLSRDCSSCNAENFASNWIVVQYKFDGEPINCWKLPNTAITNEGNSDGIYWKDGQSGHLVHISGWYNRIQVSGGDWDGAAKHLSVDLKYCTNGKYLPPKNSVAKESSPEAP